MNQINQEIIQKLTLPIKTKIAAWWMIIIGLFGLIVSIITGLPELIIFLFLPSLFFFCLPFFFLLERKKWAWWFSIITQFILIICPFMPSGLGWIVGILNMGFSQMLSTLSLLRLSYGFPILSILLVPPFFLLLLDRKNFWKIAK